MTVIQDLVELQTAVESIRTTELNTIIPAMNPSASLLAIETINEQIEKAALLSRNCLERLYVGESFNKTSGAVLPHMEIAGSIEIFQYAWLHIKLNMLLPHCRFQTPQYLTDTLNRLLDTQSKGQMPYFKNAFLVIDEHCDLKSRIVFDQDNKGWKAIPNALKGRVFPDDDQFSLGLALLSTYDENPCCHIYVMNALEAPDFFNLRGERYV